MFQKVLVPLDGSGLAEAVLPYAEELALAQKALVVLLQVIPPPSHVVGFTGTADLGPMTRTDVEAIKARVKKQGYAGIFNQKLM